MLVLGLVFTIGVSATGCKKGTNNATTPEKPQYNVEPSTLTLKQGETKTITFSRTGKDLRDQDVTVSSSEPKVSAKIKDDAKGFKGDAKSVDINVTAAADAPKGDATVTVKVGTDIDKKVTVTVADAKGGAKKPITYKLESEAVTIEPGKKATVKVTREGDNLKAQTLTVEPNEKGITASVEDKGFKGEAKEAVITLTADAKIAPGTSKVNVKAGDMEVGEIAVTVPKKGGGTEEKGKKGGTEEKGKKGGTEGKGALDVRPGRDIALALRQVEALPADRVSVRRQVALFTRE